MQVKNFPQTAKVLVAAVVTLLLLGILSSVALAQSASDQDGAVTRVEVATVIEVTGPGLLAFGSGVPGDELGIEDLVHVRTNAPGGYDLTWVASDLVNTGNGVIAAENLSVTIDGGNSVAANTRTDDAGINHVLAAMIQLPFVESGTYNGTMTFTATTH